MAGAGMHTQFRFYAGKGGDSRSQCMSQREFLSKANKTESGDLAPV
tara:strand:+ start:3576 stop:3713 length:138 start_codon:yes stop_codon:yes gene_type:complete